MNVAEAIVHEAQSWEGTPFQHQARGPKGPSGAVDCVGLLVCVAEAVGLVAHDFRAYSRTETLEHLEAHLAKSCARVELERMSAGDVLAFRIGGQGHVGILMPDGGMIHGDRTKKKVARVTDLSPWRSRIASVWTYLPRAS